MRIAVVGADGHGSLARCFVRGASELGHQTRPVFANHLTAGWWPVFQARRVGLDGLVSRPSTRTLERRLAAIQPDLVLIVKGRFVDAAAVDRLRKRFGCPILNYYPDHPTWPGHNDRQTLAALARYDEVLVWADHVAESLTARRIRVRVVPFGYDPVSYAPSGDILARRYDLVLIGQHYDRRSEFVDAIADLDVLVSGRGWDRAPTSKVRRIASTRTYSAVEIRRLYCQSAFGLNILAPWNVPAHNMRTFEIPATETAMVATRTPEHERLFGDEGAVLVDEPQEARARILELLKDEHALRNLAKRGRDRVAPFTYAFRMAQLLAPWA